MAAANEAAASDGGRANGHERRGTYVALHDWRIGASAAVLLVIAVVGILAPVIEPYDPLKLGVGPGSEGPTLRHPMGTDSFGRDQLSRVIEGTRISLLASVIVAAGAFGIGLPLGLATGYSARRFDFVVGRLFDVLFAFPVILAALTLTTILEPSLRTVLIALVIVYVPYVTRFIRAATLAERGREYVLAARVSGASSLRICLRHILPNIASPALVLMTSIMAFTILAEAALSYLGFGVSPPTPSWGRMLTDEGTRVYDSPHLLIFPGLAIALAVLALNVLGDGLRDHLSPRHRHVV